MEKFWKEDLNQKAEDLEIRAFYFTDDDFHKPISSLLNAIDVKKKRCQAIPGAGGGLRIRIEIRWLRKPLKVDGTPGRIVNSMQMEMSLAKAPNKVCFYKDLLFQ